MSAAHDKTRSANQQSPSEIREAYLTVDRSGRPEHTPDVEGAVLRIEPEQVTLLLEDGESVVFDAVELRAALRDAPAAA